MSECCLVDKSKIMNKSFFLLIHLILRDKVYFKIFLINFCTRNKDEYAKNLKNRLNIFHGSERSLPASLKDAFIFAFASILSSDKIYFES